MAPFSLLLWLVCGLFRTSFGFWILAFARLVAESRFCHLAQIRWHKSCTRFWLHICHQIQTLESDAKSNAESDIKSNHSFMWNITPEYHTRIQIRHKYFSATLNIFNRLKYFKRTKYPKHFKHIKRPKHSCTPAFFCQLFPPSPLFLWRAFSLAAVRTPLKYPNLWIL